LFKQKKKKKGEGNLLTSTSVVNSLFFVLARLRRLGERDKTISEMRREMSSLEKHWTQSRLDCEILQGRMKALASEYSSAEKEIASLKGDLREARQISLTVH
jgi:septal ring factor EnvC (AmiA/AmiB activator)